MGFTSYSAIRATQDLGDLGDLFAIEGQIAEALDLVGIPRMRLVGKSLDHQA
jgi:hypothetical protein